MPARRLPPRPPPLLLGVDFTCAPSRRKPITVARGRRHGDGLTLQAIDELGDLAAFEALLSASGPWLGAFDFPFGLPREFVVAQEMGSSIAEVAAEVRRRCVDRAAWRALIDAWGGTRPPGQRLLHRRTDIAEPGVHSTSPLQTRYVPVGFMFYEGLPRLLAAGLSLPGMHEGDANRIALEAYPRLLAHELIGRRAYKNGDTPLHRQARGEIVDALQAGATRYALRVEVPATLRDAVLRDAGGDRLDALLCLVQAAWAVGRPGFGLPAQVDPLEGWITSAGVR